MHTVDVQRTNGGLMVVLMLVVVLVAGIATQLPPLTDVRLGEHAVIRHGADALAARRQVFGCRPEYLRNKYCPRTEEYGATTVFWCEPPGASVCAGMYVTLGGIEKTAFLRPCAQWQDCKGVQ